MAKRPVKTSSTCSNKKSAGYKNWMYICASKCQATNARDRQQTY